MIFSHREVELCSDLAAQAGADDPEAFADAYTMLFEGALVLRQVHDRDDAARVVRPHIDPGLANKLRERSGNGVESHVRYGVALTLVASQRVILRERGDRRI